MTNIKYKPGILDEIVKFLKEVKKNKNLKSCAIIMDAMAIRKKVVCNDSLGIFMRYVNCGGLVVTEHEKAALEAF